MVSQGPLPRPEALDAFLQEKNSGINTLVALDVEDDEIVKRLLNRGLTSGRADDNDESIIRNRIKVYNSETAQVYDYYGRVDKSVKVEGMGSIDEIFARLTGEIDKAI